MTRAAVDYLWITGMVVHCSQSVMHSRAAHLFKAVDVEKRGLVAWAGGVRVNDKKERNELKPIPSTQIFEQKQFICVYGPPGTGKTSLLETLDGKTLVLDAENGMKHIRSESVDRISLSVDEKGELVPQEKRYARLVEFMKFAESDAAKAKYQNIFIDSLTEVAQVVLRSMEATHGKDGFARWEHYAKGMSDFMKLFRDTGAYNAVFIALEDRVDLEDGTSKFLPMVQGNKVRAMIMPLFDGVVRMRIANTGEREVICRPTAKTEAKVRCKAIGEIEPAHLGKLIKKMKENA